MLDFLVALYEQRERLFRADRLIFVGSGRRQMSPIHPCARKKVAQFGCHSNQVCFLDLVKAALKAEATDQRGFDRLRCEPFPFYAKPLSSKASFAEN